jgi:hypothetical protein
MMIGYVWEWDENGEDVLVLPDHADFPLPRGYAKREAELAARALREGHDRRDLAVSRNTLHRGLQQYWAGLIPAWGAR